MDDLIQLIPIGGENGVFIFWKCPFFALLGSLAHTCVLGRDMTTMSQSRHAPNIDRLLEINRLLQALLSPIEHIFNRIDWFLARLLLGYITGVVVGLYFLSDINRINHYKVFFIAGIIGYTAPRIWPSQEHLIKQYIDRALARELKPLLVRPKEQKNELIEQQQDDKPKEGKK